MRRLADTIRVVLGICFIGLPAYAADITPDGSLGTIVTNEQNGVAITGGTISGENLFHSFNALSLDAGDTAVFRNSFQQPLARVIGRVTGGNISNIDGTLRLEDSLADLYLLNPAGFAFGPNATLDLPGSLYVAAENGLQFADGKTFGVGTVSTSGLSVAAPEAFGFIPPAGIGAPTGSISVTGSHLAVGEGRTLAFRAKDITLQNAGTIVSAPNGNITLASPLTAGGNVTIGNGALVSVAGNGAGRIALTGSDIHIADATLDASHHGQTDASGGIVIRGGQIEIGGAAEIRNTAFSSGTSGTIGILADGLRLTGGKILADTVGPGNAGDVRIIAGVLELIGDGQTGIFSISTPQGDTAQAGRGGNIDIVSGRLFLQRGAISAVSNGNAPGGAIRIVTRDALEIDRGNFNGGNGIFSIANASGQGGEIYLESPSIIISQGARVSALTFGAGKGGDVTIRAGDLKVLNGSSIFAETRIADGAGTGAAGAIDIEADTIFLRRGRVSSSSNSVGKSGQVRVVARERLEIVGGAEPDTPRQRGQIISGSFRDGDGGQIVIDASELVLRDFGFISGGSLRSGNAAPIFITADNILISGERTGISSLSVSTEADAGRGGDISIDTGSLTIRGGNISVSSEGPADSGNIEIRARDFIEIDEGNFEPENGIISAAKGNGQSGTIILESPRILVGQGGEVSAITFGNGDGGSVIIRTEDLKILSGSSLFADARDDGNAGNIDVDAKTIFLQRGRIGSNSQGRGNAGRIDIRAQDKIEIVGGALPGSGLQRGQISAGAFRQGGKGFINIETGELLISDFGIISASSLRNGKAGDIRVKADSIHISGGNLGGIESRAIAVNGPQSLGEGGNISIETGRLTMRGGSIGAESNGRGDSGSIDIEAREIIDIDLGNFSSGNGIFSTAFGQGNGGDIRLSSPVIQLGQGGQVSAITFGAGKGGSVSIDAGTLRVVNGSSIFADARRGTGDSGEIDISADTIFLQRGRISSSSNSSGRAGLIRVIARERLEVVGGTVPDTGLQRGQIISGAFNQAGDGQVIIAARDLIVRDFGFISAATRRSGNAGSITIDADTITIRGAGFTGINSRTTLESADEIAGAGGNITINARNLSVIGGFINVASEGDGDAGNIKLNIKNRLLVSAGEQRDAAHGIFTSTEGAGQGGTLQVTAGDILVVDRGRIAAGSDGDGNGGSISLRGDTILLADQGLVSAESTGAGSAGSIFIEAGTGLFVQNGRIRTTTSAADGGDIVVAGGNIMFMRNGAMTTSVSGGAGSGGNINVTQDFLVMSNSAIQANAFGGDGGNIQIRAGQLITDQLATIEASSALGIDGEISVAAPDTDVTGGLVIIEGTLLAADAVLAGNCAGNTDVARAQFKGRSRGGLNATPDIAHTILSANDFDWSETPRQEASASSPTLFTSGTLQAQYQIACR